MSDQNLVGSDILVNEIIRTRLNVGIDFVRSLQKVIMPTVIPAIYVRVQRLYYSQHANIFES